MKRILCVPLLLCLFFNVQGNGLEVGDRMPDVVVENVINYNKKRVNLADFRGKWLVLEFWAPWCSTCIGMFPKTDSLQSIYKDQVQFFAITKEPAKDVRLLFEKLKKLEGITPLIGTDDKTVFPLFDFREVPYYVWIDPKGIVRAKSDHYDMNAIYLENMIYGRKSNISTSKGASDEEYAHAESPEDYNPDVLYESVFSRFKEGLSSRVKLFPANPESGQRLLATNSSLKTLYQWAYSGKHKVFIRDNRTFVELEDGKEFIYPQNNDEKKEWHEHNLFGYNLTVPYSRKEELYSIMASDLDKYRPEYVATIEKRVMPVLALVQIIKKDIYTKGGTPHLDIKPFGAYLTNQYLISLVMMLNAKYMQHLSTPVVDMTGIMEKVDISFDATLSSPEEVNEALKPYGLALEKREEAIEVLVIRDRN